MQTVLATVTGSIHDSDTGEPLVGAEVAFVELQRSTSTDAEGRYLLRSVPPGEQRITVRFVGHTTRTVVAIVPPTGTLELDVFLVPAPVPLPGLEVRSPASSAGYPPARGRFPTGP